MPPRPGVARPGKENLTTTGKPICTTPTILEAGEDTEDGTLVLHGVRQRKIQKMSCDDGLQRLGVVVSGAIEHYQLRTGNAGGHVFAVSGRENGVFVGVQYQSRTDDFGCLLKERSSRHA